ncbi:MAG: hypothetical protein Q4G63_04400 [Bacteroidia bacterium]|nr:hypothetical protein [Bacteroidia bacterium]
MKKIITISLLLFFTLIVKSQIVYVDVLTAPAMAAQGQLLKKKQEETNDNLNKIERAQLLVFSQMQKANELQNKVVKGLNEVSAALRDAYTVKEIYQSCQRVINYGGEITKFVRENPEYSVFALPAVNSFSNRMTRLSIEVGQILLGGEANMMNSGQRRELLNNVYIEARLLASSAWNVLYTLENAKRIGFWNSLNPFRDWVDQDVRLMRDIIRRSEYLGL